MKVKSLSRVRLLATPWTAAYQAPPSMGFSRQEYWSGVPLPSLENSAVTGKSMVAGDMELGKQPIGRVHEHKQAEGRTSQALDVAKGKQTV